MWAYVYLFSCVSLYVYPFCIRSCVDLGVCSVYVFVLAFLSCIMSLSAFVYSVLVSFSINCDSVCVCVSKKVCLCLPVCMYVFVYAFV